MNGKQPKQLPLQLECACGCGRKFKPKYIWHIYYETKCRVRAWMKRQVATDVEKRVEKIEEKLGMK